MEPLDPFKNEGSSGRSKRRISSILKAPRKSIVLPDPEQQENVVECAKPVDKRNSRRVSFAPANDVLLFSKDAGNVSLARSPLQDLMTAAAADIQNRVQCAVTGDGIQQITGMETLLKAPLHTSQQRDMVNYDAGVNLGERTVMFSTEDASIDMTQCHTINISSSDADLIENISLQNYHILPSEGENKTVNTSCGSASLHSSRNLDLRAEKKNTASSVLPLDPGFESFLESLSQPSRSSVNPAVPRTSLPTGASLGVTDNSLSQLQTQHADGDKENRAPSVVPDVFEKTMNASIALFPEDDVSMDLTEAQTLTDANDDPFRCLFPSQEMYSQLDDKVLKTQKNKQQQNRRTMPLSSSKDVFLQKPSLRASLHGHQLNTEDGCKKKTIRFIADDVTGRTGNIPTNFVHQPRQNDDHLPISGEETVRFSADDAAMDITRDLTVSIAASVEPRSQQMTDVLPPWGEKTLRFSVDDATMDVTKSHTAKITTTFEPQRHQSLDVSPKCGDKTLRFNADDAAMDITRDLTVSIAASVEPRSQQMTDVLPPWGEKTLRFSVDDATMDVTKSHTAKITTTFEPKLHQSLDVSPKCGDKTLRFNADDAAMDITRDLTVSIAASVEPRSQQMTDVLPPWGEKTLRFSADDATMDVTKSHTAKIATVLEPQRHQSLDVSPKCGEKTVRFTADDAAMDTRSLTQSIAASVDPRSQQMTDVFPPGGEKTLRFSIDDATMDVTKCLTGNIACNSEFDSVLSHQESNILSTPDKKFPSSEKRKEFEPCHKRKTRSFTGHSLNLGFQKPLPRKSGPSAFSVSTKASYQDAMDPIRFEDQPTQNNDMETETPPLVSPEKLVNKTVAEDVTVGITDAQTDQILRQTDEYPQGLTSTENIDLNCNHFGETEVISQNHNGPESLASDADKITNHPESLDSNERDTWKESEVRPQALSSPQKPESSPAAVNHTVDAAPSRKSRRMSLADLHSKVRRLSQMINTAPDAAAMDSCTTHNMDNSPKDRTQTLPVIDPELETTLTNPNENTEAQNQIQEEQSPPVICTTPVNLKTKLISRLSVSGFKAKLPQRTRPDDQKQVNSVGEPTRTMTLNFPNELNNFDADMSDINDEELASLEDMSETIDARTPLKTSRPLSPEKINMEEPSEDDVFEQDFMSAVCGRKRPMLEEENGMEEDEKRMKGSIEVDSVCLSPAEGELAAECEGYFTTAPITSTQGTDYSNISHTGSRCEATFESTSKHSLFESQLEEYASDVQAKFDDGTITVLEFFKLFNIHFVIHAPRQSVNIGRVMSDSDCTPMDLLKNRHIIRPKQIVYESDVRNLTERVEGLKGRMQDLEKPLRLVNRALWEEMRNLSEGELKSFGAKLKERNHFFRKMSKIQSHDMKEVLYSQLVQTNLEEQQKLIQRIEEADEMIKSLDECIREVETEIAAVEEKGSEDKPSLRSCQEELLKVTETLGDRDRQKSELEIQKTQNSSKIKRLITETRNLESHIEVLNMINEWRFGGKTDDSTVYTFLHETVHLQLNYNKSDSENPSERKVSDIKFRLQLDAEKSEDHACLVHKLLSQYIDGETCWVEKYSTSRHVPTLLHDVSLVVSRCRLLGEELRLLKMWGGLKLNILSINCEDTRVVVIFSSLKTLTKFEVNLSVSLSNRLCVFQVQSFRNLIGSTRIEQIEEIVTSFSPSKNLLTKIIKKIHEKLLC